MSNIPDNKLKGFSIIEMMITLVLTSLVVSSAYFFLINSQKSLTNYRIKSEFVNEYCCISNCLNQLFNQSYLIEYHEAGCLKVYGKHKISEIKVRKGEYIAITENDESKHFDLKIKKVEVTPESSMDVRNMKYLVKSISITFEFKEREFNITLQKYHDSYSKINYITLTNGEY